MHRDKYKEITINELDLLNSYCSNLISKLIACEVLTKKVVLDQDDYHDIEEEVCNYIIAKSLKK